LDRLPFKIGAAVVKFCTAVLSDNPYWMAKPLRYELECWHVARRGDYRVILQILEHDNVLLIGQIEHPAHVYHQ
jgi:mRNA-degrading endonuclease RelE of RelBE toxin-antitoxin system